MTTPGAGVPRFCDGVQFKFSTVRQCWVLLAPERLFQPDDQAVEVLKLIDGNRSIDDIIAVLATAFEATPELIGNDVRDMLQDLMSKGVVRW